VVLVIDLIGHINTDSSRLSGVGETNESDPVIDGSVGDGSNWAHRN